jgi:hypothetical protein
MDALDASSHGLEWVTNGQVMDSSTTASETHSANCEVTVRFCRKIRRKYVFMKNSADLESLFVVLWSESGHRRVVRHCVKTKRAH